MMKTPSLFLIATAVVSICASSSVFAQTTQNSPSANTTSASLAPQSVPNQAYVPATRAQVYQDLVQAETDGQLKHLNATVYAHH